MRDHPNKQYYETLFATCSQMMLTLTKIPQIVIAKVHGMATAAGCQLVANADLAIASQDARFAVSGVNLGLFCSTPSVPLSRNVSRKRAFEMLVTGDFIDASTAVDYGLVNQAVPAESLDRAINQLAQNIAGKPAQTLRAGKALFYQQLNLGLAEAYQIAGETMACNMLFEDAVEGIDAFIQKRTPDWR
jgi:enoyl-CoA hydratase/carnithine racemase